MNTIKTTPKDFFLYVAATVSLYVAVISLINLVFSIVNYSFPDALAYGYSASNLAWPISMIIVLIPVFYILEWLIGKDIRQTPEKAMLWIRRWRTYLTLFLTGATIIGDVIVLINVYLSGEITTRFIWKILAVLVITGVVFVYYMLDRQDATPRVAMSRKILAWSGIILALAAIVGGFAIVGSPGTQRDIRLDQQKVNDLQNIQWQVVSYWQNKGALPTTLDDLKDPLSYSKIPLDAQSNEPYGFKKVASTTFELCAVFNRANEDTKGRGPTYGRGGMSISYPAYDGVIWPNGEEVWDHEAGNFCFERKIDVDRYPVNPKPTPLKAL